MIQNLSELVATTVVSDVCCVELHCHAERSHLMTDHCFGLAGLGGQVGRFYYQGHWFDVRSGRLVCAEKYDWWAGGWGSVLFIDALKSWSLI
jgi:hypothetical protein